MVSTLDSGPTQDVPAKTKVRIGRLGFAFFISQIGWAIPSSAQGTLLQQIASIVAGDNKVYAYAVAGTVGALVGSVGAVTAGILSDKLHARTGTRFPLLIAGAIFATLAFLGGSFIQNTGQLVLVVALYQLGICALTTTITALMPEYVVSEALGRVSTGAGLGVLAGQSIGGAAGGLLVTHARQGMLIVPWTLPVAALLLFAILRPMKKVTPPPTDETHSEEATTDAAAVPLEIHDVSLQEQMVGDSFVDQAAATVRHHRIGDASFWWVFAGRAVFILALYMASQYLLFICTDYLHMTTEAAGKLIATATVAFALTAAVFIAISGPLSDRIKRRKPFVGGASLLLVIAAIPMAVTPSAASLTIFMVVAGAAFGSYIAVDQALMVDALPNHDSNARDLGILGLATTLPGVFAPAVAGAIVTVIGYTGLFTIVAALGLVGAACMLGVRRLR